MSEEFKLMMTDICEGGSIVSKVGLGFLPTFWLEEFCWSFSLVEGSEAGLIFFPSFLSVGGGPVFFIVFLSVDGGNVCVCV